MKTVNSLIMMLLVLVSQIAMAARADRETDYEPLPAVISTQDAEDDSWILRDDQRVAVDRELIDRPWKAAPFETRFFDIPEDRLAEAWPRLMRGLLIPYPSAEYLKTRIEHFPELREELGPNFNDEYERLSHEILHAWRLFFRGDFRAAKDHGMKLGAYGKVPAYFAQIIQAIYLTESNQEKHQMLQDAADQVAVYVKVLKEMEGDPRFKEDIMMLRLGYAYAIARIAEDMPVMVSLARNYLFKISAASNDVLAVHENHPVGLAFRAGIDANLIRVVGKAVGRLTFGARQTRAQGYFEESFAVVDDIAIIHYEYANALLYINKSRDAEEIIEHLMLAQSLPPAFAMEALDSMYANKRLREVQDFLRYGKSFRAYERMRRDYVSKTDENLYSVLKPPFLLTEEGEQVGMAER
ncbi:MAG: hypothetical protein V2I38_04350 [Alcanivoracaceae bacterium]|jgi:hypothetical protein|nr:hypothetical protein [Alcanivoracaceae bacterium]